MSVPDSGHHRDATGSELHVPGYIQDTDPGAVGAGMLWIHPTTGVARKRNADNDGWILVGRQAEAQADSTATDTSEMIVDFNALLAKLRAAGILETS